MTISNVNSEQLEPQPAKREQRNLWQWLVEPAASVQDLASRRQARLLSALLVFIIPVMANGAFWSWRAEIASGNFSANPLVLASTAIALVIVYGLSRTKYYQLAAKLALGILAVLTFAQVVAQGNYDPNHITDNLMWAGVVVLLASMFLTARGTVVLSVILFIGVLLFSVIMFKVGLVDILGLLSFIAIISLLILVSSHYRNQLERDRQVELSERNRELGTISALLEQRVADLDRTAQTLKTNISISQHLSTVLDQSQLLDEMVKEIDAAFNYYHTHIYLLDSKQEKLVVVAGIGPVGEEMKAKGHYISLSTPTSLVARAARTGEVVLVDNVHEAEDWLPNPLLPDTYAEMAIPIVLAGHVVGVLDVQADKIAGLDEGDASLLRSLANQAAVAIRNARLFEEVETALAEARAAQARYAEQAWQQVRERNLGGQYHYAQAEAPELSEATVILARQQALTHNDLAVVALADNDSTSPAIVAPIKVANQPIGALQLHPLRADQSWTEDDLALTAAVVDELARTAESLRLFEETRQRVAYESLVGEITQKLRQAPTFDILAQTAAEALSDALGVSHSLIKVGVTSPAEHTARNGEQG